MKKGVRNMNPVVHFEMPYEDSARMSKFYEGAFGWQTQSLGEEMGNYVLATTTETAEGRPTTPGTINGGFFARPDDESGHHPSIVISVDNIHMALKNVIECGGEVMGEPMSIPGVGEYAAFLDTEGNRVGMLQPLPRA
jgi:predicted enzyme related to lactoylglutathione lyase